MTGMIAVTTALELILQHASSLPGVELPTADALGLVLAEHVASDIDSPPWDKSLVDGYAVQAADITVGCERTIIEQVVAGQSPTREVTSGHVTRIMTGAPLPRGADAVVMIEQTELSAPDRVRIQATTKPNQHILRRAATMRQGEVVLPPGQQLRAIELGVLAEVGRTRVSVVRRPRVAILTTGDELVPPEVRPTGAQIRNSNGTLLAALAQTAGAEVIPLGIARDDRDDLANKIRAGLSTDILLLSGGVSAGVLDLVPQVLASLDVQQVFHKVNLKPGKPLWFGVREHHTRTLAFGLPGNPVSTLVCFGLFVRPTLLKLAGHTIDLAVPPRTARLTADFEQRDTRPTYFPAVVHTEPECDWVTPLPWQGSADLRTLAAANCLAYFPGGPTTHARGNRTNIYPL